MLCAPSNFVHTSGLKVDVHVGYLQGVLNAVGEVLEGAQRDGFIRPRCLLPVRLCQVRHHHRSVTHAPLSPPFQHWPLVFNTAFIEIDPWPAK